MQAVESAWSTEMKMQHSVLSFENRTGGISSSEVMQTDHYIAE